MPRLANIEDFGPAKAILWQYESAKKLVNLILDSELFYLYSVPVFWFDFTRDVFDVRTANEFGLSIWSRILAMPFSISPSQNDGAKWAFGDERENFEHGNFGDSGGNLGVSLETLRLLVMLRIVQLTERPVATRLNRRFSMICEETGYPKFYVIDNQDMTMTYTFTRPLSRDMQRALDSFNVLPRPSGVGFNINIVPQDAYFGFGVDDNNFDGGFAPDANV